MNIVCDRQRRQKKTPSHSPLKKSHNKPHASHSEPLKSHREPLLEKKKATHHMAIWPRHSGQGLWRLLSSPSPSSSAYVKLASPLPVGVFSPCLYHSIAVASSGFFGLFHGLRAHDRRAGHRARLHSTTGTPMWGRYACSHTACTGGSPSPSSFALWWWDLNSEWCLFSASQASSSSS